MIRSLLTATVAIVLALATPWAAAADLVFSVTEGVTYYQTNKEIASRFQPLTDPACQSAQAAGAHRHRQSL